VSGRAAAVALLVGLLVVLGGTGYVSVQRLKRQMDVSRICDAAQMGDWARAVAHGEGPAGADEDGRIAAECLCWAYAATDQLDACVVLLDRILSDPEGEDWVPDVTLARMLLRKRIEVGAYPTAAEFARKATRAYPDDVALLELELLSRGAIEGEHAVLEDMRARVTSSGEASLHTRLVVASGYERLGDYQTALEVLGETPPLPGDPALRAWFEASAAALGALGRADALRALYASWRERGGDEYEIRARYAIRLSQFGLEDPQHSREQLLRQAIVDEERLEDESLHRTLYERLVGRLLVDQKVDQALEIYDRAVQRFDNILISREEILRTARAGHLSDLARADEPNTIVFRLPEDAPPGAHWLSPPLDVPPDTAYQRIEARRAGELVAKRVPGQYPFRWVYLDADGHARASGSTWADRTHTEIDVRIRDARPNGFTPPQQAMGDGRRRIFVLINDCQDWRLTQYLLARGDLPMHHYLLGRGQRAVIESVPAFTGAAMESIVWPQRGERATFVGLLNRLGLEVAGLASVGTNPFRFLNPLLPEGETLFERVGAGDRVALNLLFSHGHIEAGRHAELVGPAGRRRGLTDLRSMRALRTEEMADLPAGLHIPQYRAEVHKMAAELDLAVELAREGEIDLMVLRVEPLDIMTHGFFTELMRPAQDDGLATLLWAYRYIDTRLAEVYAALDADDVLIVMSDHGIRTALEHEEDAFFVAVGEGVPHGRVPGMPHLRGFPELIARLFELETDWPDTGMASWVGDRQHARTRQAAPQR
jgi:tetratricopeptide (TPR) repeat protein